jgi:hypothetical protein
MLYQQLIDELERMKSHSLDKKSIANFRKLFTKYISKFEHPKEVAIQVCMTLNTILSKQLSANKIPGGNVTDIIIEVNKINEIIKHYFF